MEQIIETLKSRERELRSLLQLAPSESNRLKEEFQASKLMAPELYWAIQRNNVSNFLSVLEELSSKDGMVSDIVEKVTRGGNTILHLAAQHGSHEILGLVANRFPQLIIRTNIAGDTALHVAAGILDEELTKIILTYYDAQRHSSGSRFYKEKETNLLRIKNEIGNTALHEAVMTLNFDAVRLLFRADEAVANYLNKEGKSPLYLAVETGHEAIIDLLLEASLQNRERHQGTSPLHAATMAMSSGQKCKHKFQSLVEGWMIDKTTTAESSPARTRSSDFSEGQISEHKFQSSVEGCKTDSPTNFKAWPTRTKITYCGQIIKHKFESLVKGSKTERATNLEPSPTRTKMNHCEKILRKISELVYLKDQKGGTPLHFAASMGNLEGVLTILKACPLCALEWDLKGYLPIHIACKKGHVNVVKEFVEKQEPWFDSMELLNRKGQNILHIAAKNGTDTVVKYILREKKLEKLLNMRDKNGNTPLHLASKYLHPKILQLQAQEKRLDINLVNNEGMTARDIVMLRRRTPPTFREFLSFTILKSVGTPLTEKGRRIRRSHTEPPQIEWIKDRVSTILLVATLVATVTFAAGFSMPGGVYNSDDIDTKKRGMATLLNRKMFQLFTICDAIAMYSSTMGSFILLWAQLGNFHIAFNATYFALYLVGLALITMSVAFMAAAHLVLSNVSWLADTVMIIGIIFLLMFLGAFILLIFPLGERALFFGHISDSIFKMIIPFSRSYGKLPKNVKKMTALEEIEKDRDKDEPQQGRAKMVVRQEMLVRRRTF